MTRGTRRSRVDLPGEPRVVDADRNRLAQMNLLSGTVTMRPGTDRIVSACSGLRGLAESASAIMGQGVPEEVAAHLCPLAFQSGAARVLATASASASTCAPGSCRHGGTSRSTAAKNLATFVYPPAGG